MCQEVVSARENHEARRGASSSCILFRSIPPWLPGTRAFLQHALSSLRLALGHLASLVTSLPGIPMMLYMGQRQASRHHSVGGAPCPPHKAGSTVPFTFGVLKFRGSMSLVSEVAHCRCSSGTFSAETRAVLCKPRWLVMLWQEAEPHLKLIWV